MIDQLIELFQSNRDPGKLRAVIAKQREIITRLQVENVQLRHENRLLRRRLRDAELRIVRRAQDDAILIGALHFAGLETSRRACAEIGISQWRWTTAQAFLRTARITDHGGRDWRVDTPEEYERAVHVAVERLQRDGFEGLRHRLPLCRQRAV